MPIIIFSNQLLLLYNSQRYFSQSMKLMKIYQIEKNYQLHKDRLLSISTINNKGKMIACLQSNINKINNYKRIKIQTEVFHERQKFDRIASQNYNLRNRMMQVNNRQSQLIKDRSKNHSSSKSLKSLKSININTKFLKQNLKIRERLMNTKSNYYHMHNIKKRKANSTSKRKDEVLYLLENQLGIKPTVVFPQVKTQNRQTNSVLKYKKRSLRTYTQQNTEGLNLSKEKKTLSINYSMDLGRK